MPERVFEIRDSRLMSVAGELSEPLGHSCSKRPLCRITDQHYTAAGSPSHQFGAIPENLAGSFEERRGRILVLPRRIAYERMTARHRRKRQIVIVEVFAIGNNDLNSFP